MPKQLRKFDFKHKDFKKSNRKPMQKFLIENHDMPVTEADFIAFTKDWNHWPPTRAKNTYRRLVNNYGLFPGGQ